MERAEQLSDFLKTRRARLTPSDVDLPEGLTARRVPGLRREEVAALAGISVDYYIRLERGSGTGVSDDVLESLARALRLDDLERTHLHRLARERPTPAAAGAPGPTDEIRPGLARLVDAMADVPTFVTDRRGDIVATNDLGRALYSPVFESTVQPPNTLRFLFLDPASRDFFPDWDDVAEGAIGSLRTRTALAPDDPALNDLVEELAATSDAFRARWAEHRVHRHRAGVKRVRHPVVGPLELSFEVIESAADPELGIVGYTAPAGSPSDEALRLLASWAATSADLDRKP